MLLDKNQRFVCGYEGNLDLSILPTIPMKRVACSLKEKVVGKFKDECAGMAARLIVGLRSKIDSLRVKKRDKHPKMTAKGIRKAFVKRGLRHASYMHTLYNLVKMRARYLNSKLGQRHITTREKNKTCLSAFDNKLYIRDNGISSWAYGHFRIGTAKPTSS